MMLNNIEEVLGRLLPLKVKAKIQDTGDFLMIRAWEAMATQACMLNGTARAVYFSCDGNTSVLDIVNLMQRDYPQINRKQLLFDAMGVFRDLERSGILKMRILEPSEHIDERE